jgi:hypothetical protein
MSIAAMVAGPESVDFTVPWNVTLEATRFGDIAVGTNEVGEWSEAPPAAQETHTLNATLSDWQQAIPGKSGGDYSINGVGAVTTGLVWLEDASLSGAKAVLMAGLDYPSDPIRRRPTGFLEITLTGTPGVDGVATISVARTRAQTLGAVAYVEAGALGVKYMNAGMLRVRVVDGNPPACNGPIIADDFPIDLGLSDGGSWQVQFGTRTRTATLTNRILAATYDGEALVDTPLSANNVATDSAGTPSFAGSGVRIGTLSNSGEVSPDGTCRATQGYTQSSDTMLWQYTSNLTSVAQCSLTLAHGSTGVTIEGSETVSVEQVTWATNANGRPTLASSATGPVKWSRTYAGHTDAIQGSDVTTTHPPDQGQLIVVFTPLKLAVMSMGIGLGADADGFFADQVIAGANAEFDPPKIRHAVQRYSNRLFELLVNPLNAANVPTGWDYLGAVGGDTTGNEQVGELVELPYGSHNPESGEITRAQALPVVYV